MRGRWGLKVMVALVATLLIAGTVSAAEQTRDHYIQEVDPICKHADKRIAPLLQHFSDDINAGKFRQAGFVFEQATRIYERSLDKIAVVETPQDDDQIIGPWVLLQQEDIKVSHLAAKQLQLRHFEAAHKSLQKSLKLEHRIKDSVRGYGFIYCA